MSEKASVAIIPLDGNNYCTWRLQVKMALIRDNCWGIVNGDEIAPTEASELQKYNIRKNRALALVVLAIDPKILYLVGDPDDPKTVWKLLADQFQKKSWSNRLALRRKLFSLRLGEGDSVQSHIKTMVEIFNELNAIEDKITEEDKVVYLLASLPDSYNMLVTALEASAEVPKFEVVTERILHEETKISVRSSSAENSASGNALSSFGKRRRTGIKCFFCDMPGHIKRNCHLFKKENSKNSKSEVKHGKLVKSDSDDEIVLHALSSSDLEVSNSWIVDSGASNHMTHDESLFLNMRNLNKPISISLGDGHKLETTKIGDVKLNYFLEGKSKHLILKDVYYIPGLAFNLLSVSKSSEFGVQFNFDSKICSLIKDGKLIAVAEKVGNIFYLKISNEQNSLIGECKVDKNIIWHKRFGHLGKQNLDSLSKNSMVKDFDYDASIELEFCPPCVAGKQSRSKFENSSSKSTAILQLVHSDICGKLDVPSKGGAQYFLTFIDDYSRYVWVYPLKSKSQVFEKFVQWKAQVENECGEKLKTFRTDGGGEYCSSEFEQFLLTNGVRHQKTVPKTPQQNGVSERYNRTLVEMVRSMISDSGLSKDFWAECLATAAYIKNRSPSAALVNKTPFEMYFGTKPSVKNFRIFGCEAFAWVPKDERKKLDSKTRKCVFVGYGADVKGYRLFDTTKSKIFHSRDVTFNETTYLKPETKMVSIEFSENSPIESSETPNLRRSTRERKPTEFYGERAFLAKTDPKDVHEALSCPESDKWEEAMKQEMDSIKENNVWSLVQRPENKSTVKSKWIFKRKFDSNGNIIQYKARLVAQGYTQKFGVDYDETFAPVVRFESVRVLLAFAVKHELKLKQIDVTTAFLNGDLKEEIYIEQPENFENLNFPDHVCRLHKSLYGLKQSPRCWNLSIHNFLTEIGLCQSMSDPCIYSGIFGDNFVLLAVYVDDIILACKNETCLDELISVLQARYKIKMIGNLENFLGVTIQEDNSKNSIWIGQRAFCESILDQYGMSDCKPVDTPYMSDLKLDATDEDEEPVDIPKYQALIGSLLHLTLKTRPDISFAVSVAARYSSRPTSRHWIAVKRILRYLRGTTNLGILYGSSGNTGGSSTEKLYGFADADWAGDAEDRKSTSGYCFLLCGGTVSWSSKKQACVALSTAEAEYLALGAATQEAIWLRQVLESYGGCSDQPTEIFEDNQAAITMTKTFKFHGRAKHIGIKHHFIRQQIEEKVVFLTYCPSEFNLADLFTKVVSREKFVKFRMRLGLC